MPLSTSQSCATPAVSPRCGTDRDQPAIRRQLRFNDALGAFSRLDFVQEPAAFRVPDFRGFVRAENPRSVAAQFGEPSLGESRELLAAAQIPEPRAEPGLDEQAVAIGAETPARELSFRGSCLRLEPRLEQNLRRADVPDAEAVGLESCQHETVLDGRTSRKRERLRRSAHEVPDEARNSVCAAGDQALAIAAELRCRHAGDLERLQRLRAGCEIPDTNAVALRNRRHALSVRAERRGDEPISAGIFQPAGHGLASPRIPDARFRVAEREQPLPAGAELEPLDPALMLHRRSHRLAGRDLPDALRSSVTLACPTC